MVETPFSRVVESIGKKYTMFVSDWVGLGATAAVINKEGMAPSFGRSGSGGTGGTAPGKDTTTTGKGGKGS